MADVHGFPMFEVQFTKKGVLHDSAEVDALVAHLGASGTTDLLVLSHGWNNDMAEARSLYEQLLGSLRARIDAGGPAAGRSFAVLGVLWPSKKFADRDLIPGGGAASLADVDDLQGQLAELRGAFDAPDADQKLGQVEALLDKIEESAAARQELVDAVRDLLPEAPDDEDEWSGLLDQDGDELLRRLALPVLPSAPMNGGGAAGGMTLETPPPDQVEAAGLLSGFRGMRGGVRLLLNFATVYQMKERAGLVGREGLHPVLRRVQQAHPFVKLHLAGHSFGARLVTSAAMGPVDQPPIRVASLTMLQAAFSHHGLAQRWNGADDGYFRPLVDRGVVSGPVLITHTANDRAVGLLYPMAFRLARQNASFLGGPDDEYGGMGRNGAQKTPEAEQHQLLTPGDAYNLTPGRVHNLLADQFVFGHSDVHNLACGHAILSAVAAT